MFEPQIRVPVFRIELVMLIGGQRKHLSNPKRRVRSETYCTAQEKLSALINLTTGAEQPQIRLEADTCPKVTDGACCIVEEKDLAYCIS